MEPTVLNYLVIAPGVRCRTMRDTSFGDISRPLTLAVEDVDDFLLNF